MCWFHAKGVYEQSIFAELEYAWRLDDDSRLLRHIDYDLFAYMRSNRLIYGYVKALVDLRCINGLWPAVDECLAARNGTPTTEFFSETPRG